MYYQTKKDCRNDVAQAIKEYKRNHKLTASQNEQLETLYLCLIDAEIKYCKIL